MSLESKVFAKIMSLLMSYEDTAGWIEEPIDVLTDDVRKLSREIVEDLVSEECGSGLRRQAIQ